MQKILLGSAILLGLCIAYVDSRPGWDDTGITVGLIILSSGLITLLGYKRSWLSALALGIWMPIYEVYQSHAFTPAGAVIFPVMIVLFAAVGAYAGWAVRLGLRKVFHAA